MRVQLNDIGWAFPRGHRIRVTVQSACWPLVMPSPEPVILALTTGASTLELPVRPRRAEDSKLPSLGRPETAKPLEVTTWSPYRRARSTDKDFVTGESTIRMVKDRGHYRIEETATELAGGGVETYRIVDDRPLSASAEVAYHIGLKRGEDWDTTIDTRFVLTATADHFLLSTHADARMGGTRIWTRSWEDKIPRNGT